MPFPGSRARYKQRVIIAKPRQQQRSLKKQQHGNNSGPTQGHGRSLMLPSMFAQVAAVLCVRASVVKPPSKREKGEKFSRSLSSKLRIWPPSRFSSTFSESYGNSAAVTAKIETKDTKDPSSQFHRKKNRFQAGLVAKGLEKVM